MARRPRASDRAKKVASVKFDYEIDLDILDEEIARTRDGSSRRELFYRFPSFKEQPDCAVEMRVLPVVGPYGPKAVEGKGLYYFRHVAHFVTETNDSGKKFQAGVTCVRHLREEHPVVWQMLLEQDSVKDEDCFFCQLLDKYEEKDEKGRRTWPELPKGMFGPALGGQLRANCWICFDPESPNYVAEFPIRLAPLPVTVIKQLNMKIRRYAERRINLLDAGKGRPIEVNRYAEGGRPKYDIEVLDPCPIPINDWQEKVEPLETKSIRYRDTNWQVAWLESQESYAHLLAGGRKKTAAKKAARKRAPSRKKAASRGKVVK